MKFYLFVKPILKIKSFLKLLYIGIKRAEIKSKFGKYDCRYISHDFYYKYPENITLGDNVRISLGVSIGAHSSVVIGNDVTISQGVIIETAGLNRHSIKREHKSKDIFISDGVWIGANAIILAGVSIGEKAIIGAGSVVRNDVEAGEVFTNG
ncbi:acyltransferase [Vibrio sp. SCSIO 43132]|uniref:acyltransferase n=1 Tax=Vibrio sp. SCSIO 43132 TaxID=2779363 RepID=UPI001CA831B4|nr:acyltransferase [Vibrio sp. SCSIO 43132]UAB70540.1 acyltransferase [Vibrio sp. SCSIO 43132]